MPRISDLTRVNEVSDGDVFPIEQASSGRSRSVAFKTIRDDISADVDAAVSIAVAAAAAAELAAASSDAQVLRGDLSDGATALKGADLVAYAAGETVRDAIAASKQFDADLSNTSDPAKGAAIVGYRLSPEASPWAVAGKLNTWCCILDYIPSEEHSAIRAGTSTYDCKPAFDKAMAEFRKIYCPDGRYLLSAPIVTDGGEFNGYTLQGGYTIVGESQTKTILTRGKTDPSVRIESDAEGTYTTQAAVNFHGMYHTIENMTIEECDVGVFYGQNTEQAFDTYVSKCTLRNVIIRECGTGISCTVSKGITYSDFEHVHVYRCQIGMRSRDGRWPSSSAPYFNRNKFRSIRFSRCWVGLWLSRGDTNTLYSVDAEGVNNSSAVDGIPAPTGLPPVPGVVGGVPTKGIAILFHDAPYNRVFGTTVEACEVRIADYNSLGNSNLNQYFGMQVGETVSDPDSVFFTQPPAVWISDRSFLNRFQSSGESAFVNIDPYMGNFTMQYKVPLRLLNPDIQAGEFFGANLTPGGGFKDTWTHLGSMPNATTKTVTISPTSGGRNAFEFVKFEFTASNSVDRIGVNLSGVLVLAHSNTNNNILRARVDQPVLHGFTAGGGDAFNNSNSGFVTVAVIVSSGSAQLTFTNNSGAEYTGCSIRLRTVRAR